MSIKKRKNKKKESDYARMVAQESLILEAPEEESNCVVPLYFHLGGAFRNQLPPALDVQDQPSAYGFATEWAQMRKKQTGAPEAAAPDGSEHWSPATEGFECKEMGVESVAEHEFSLTA